MSNTLLRNLDLFRKLCGDDALSNIRLVTTNWDLLLSKKEGERIEKELCEEYWSPFIKSGAQLHRFQYTCASAWEIVSSLPMEQKPMQIQKELVDENKPLLVTAAGQFLVGLVLRDLPVLARIGVFGHRVTSLTSSSLNPSSGRPVTISQLAGISAARSSLAKLQDVEAQSIVDFLNKVSHIILH
jgi:hypothetical protein